VDDQLGRLETHSDRTPPPSPGFNPTESTLSGDGASTAKTARKGRWLEPRAGENASYRFEVNCFNPSVSSLKTFSLFVMTACSR
jgi:hypothetical protein